MNHYQRITRDGKTIQAGSIDTAQKFEQLTAGISLKGMRVLDVGCNLGEMCRLAKDAGAGFVRGIDIEPDYIRDARRLNPDIPFDVMPAHFAGGSYDVAICSAMLHYCDIDRVLAQLARVTTSILCDVALTDGAGMRMEYDLSRRLFYPTTDLFVELAYRHFNSLVILGKALSPDDSKRIVYRLSGPRPIPAEAKLLYGRSGSGKTTSGRELAFGKDFCHLELDAIFIDWRINVEPGSLSVSDFVEQIWTAPVEVFEGYLKFHREYIFRWLGGRMCRDVVIEGFDMASPRYLEMVRGVLKELGWTDIVAQDLSQ